MHNYLFGSIERNLGVVASCFAPGFLVCRHWELNDDTAGWLIVVLRNRTGDSQPHFELFEAHTVPSQRLTAVMHGD